MYGTTFMDLYTQTTWGWNNKIPIKIRIFGKIYVVCINSQNDQKNKNVPKDAQGLMMYTL